MKLVMVYQTGDGCTFTCEETVPFEYDSLEQAIVDLENLIKQNQNMGWREQAQFMFAGREFTVRDFMDEGQVFLPEFYTLEDWFEDYKR